MSYAAASTHPHQPQHDGVCKAQNFKNAGKDSTCPSRMAALIPAPALAVPLLLFLPRQSTALTAQRTAHSTVSTEAARL